MGWNIGSEKFKSFNIQEMNWEQAREGVKQVSPHLFNVIESLDPNNTLTIIKARYPYGAKIYDEGKLHLPHISGKTIPTDSAEFDDNFKEKLLYSKIPLSLPLNKACEVFIKIEDRAIPLRIISPGGLFGLFEVTAMLSELPINPAWSISSGARSIFMLPKISNTLGYNRLRKKLNMPLNVPRGLEDHWSIFTLLANHPSYADHWYTDVLFFTADWFKRSLFDQQWAPFYNYLFREKNIQSYYNRDDVAFNPIWQNFIYAIGRRNLRPRPYILDTAKQLVAIASGMAPGFCPADSSEVLAPTKILQDLYVESYGLKNYLPTIMHAHILMKGQKMCPVYYSLAYPILQEGLPVFKSHPDVISDEREIKLLLMTLEAAAELGKFKLLDANFLHQRKFEFFHNVSDIFNEIIPSQKIPEGDPSLEKDKERFPDREFCATSPFLSGCIQISPERE